MLEILHHKRTNNAEPELLNGILTNIKGVMSGHGGMVFDDSTQKNYNGSQAIRFNTSADESLRKVPIGDDPFEVSFDARATDMVAVRQRVSLGIYLSNGYAIHFNYVYQLDKKPALTMGTSAEYLNPRLHVFEFVPVVNTTYKYKFRFDKNQVLVYLNEVLVRTVAISNRATINGFLFGGYVDSGNGFVGSLSNITLVKK